MCPRTEQTLLNSIARNWARDSIWNLLKAVPSSLFLFLSKDLSMRGSWDETSFLKVLVLEVAASPNTQIWPVSLSWLITLSPSYFNSMECYRDLYYCCTRIILLPGNLFNALQLACSLTLVSFSRNGKFAYHNCIFLVV